MKVHKLLLGLLFVGIAPILHAAGASKVAVLDLQAVVLMSEAGQRGMGELEKNSEYSSLRAKLENYESELKSLDEEQKGKGLTWGEKQRNEHRAKMEGIAQERQGALMTLNRARESVFVQMLGAMEPAIGAALEEIMSKDGIELILDSKSVIHKVPAADITQAVVERLNKMSAEAAKQAKP